jgi:hypothetical protein
LKSSFSSAGTLDAADALRSAICVL